MGNKGSISLQNDGEVNWVGDKLLLKDIHLLIEKSRQTIASFVNAELTMLYWHVGRRIKQEIMHHKRAEYGKLILQTLCAKLSWSHFKDIIYIDDPLNANFTPKCVELRVGACAHSEKELMVCCMSVLPCQENQMSLFLTSFNNCDKGIDFHLIWSSKTLLSRFSWPERPLL